MPAEVVCGGAVREYKWSDDGKRVAAIVDRSSKGKRAFFLVTGGIGLPNKDHAGSYDDAHILSVGADGTVMLSSWGKDGNGIVAVTSKGRSLLYRSDPEDPAVGVFVRPSDGRVFVAGRDWIATGSGASAKRFQLKGTFLGFSTSGSFILRRQSKYVAVDLSTAKESPAALSSVFAPGESTLLTVEEGKEQDLNLSWADPKEEMPSSVTVSRESGQARVLADNSKVSFLVAGALVYRPLVKTDIATALGLADELEAAERLKVAKQAALGLLLFAADHDDTLLGADWRDSALPYMKSRKGFEGFTRTFEGRNARGVKDPSKTELGFVSGRGGRAIAYLDGSVRWEPIKR